MYNFKHTTDVLINAYHNNKLINGDCEACAVGNIVADACNVKINDARNWIDSKGNEVESYWGDARDLKSKGIGWDKSINSYSDKGLAEMHKTGYSFDELARVEFAFENFFNVYKMDTDHLTVQEHRCLAIKRVINVLADIHGVSAKERLETLARI